MLIPFDTSLLLGLVSILLIILTPMLIVEDKNNAPLLNIVRGIDKDLLKYYQPLLDKAKRYSHEKNLKGKKLRIHRMLGNFPDPKDKSSPQFIAAVAGMAIVGWVYCLFLGMVSYIYSGLGNASLIDWILISGQFSLIVEFVVYWFGKTFPVVYPTLFFIVSLLLFSVGIVLGIVLVFTGSFFHVIDAEDIKWFYLGSLIVPLTPIIMTIVELFRYFIQENIKYYQLKIAVSDFEESKKESGKRRKKK